MTSCFPEEDAPGKSDDNGESTESSLRGSIADTGLPIENVQDEESPGASPLERVPRLFDHFLSKAMDSARPVDLYAPAKHEVICGFVSRAARVVFATLRAPHLWSGEHGMSTMRILSETKIVLAWMSTQDESVYERYQEYGRGKAKLMRIHMQNLADSFPAGPPPELSEALEHFSKRLGGEWGEQFQDVSLDSTFSGLSVRDMALATGLGDEYRHIYQPASGIGHGEWWAIEDYAMQRCMNPLHLFHRIPSLNPEFPTTPAFGDLLVGRLEELVDQALESLFESAADD